MVKSTGAWSDAATVCPTSTLREMTTPSMGEMMFVYERLTCAWLRAARVCSSCALATSTPALATARFVCAVSRSACVESPCWTSAVVRAKTRSAASWFACAWTSCAAADE
jgi:hypothetical protein